MESQTLLIHDLLYRLGLTANYVGFFHLSCALALCLEQPERLLLVTKLVYPDVAKQYQTTQQAVERNLRTACKVIWLRNQPMLEQLAHRTLMCCPSNAQLLAMLTTWLSMHGPGDKVVALFMAAP